MRFVRSGLVWTHGRRTFGAVSSERGVERTTGRDERVQGIPQLLRFHARLLALPLAFRRLPWSKH
jgi:hypothetical protein